MGLELGLRGDGPWWPIGREEGLGSEVAAAAAEELKGFEEAAAVARGGRSVEKWERKGAAEAWCSDLRVERKGRPVGCSSERIRGRVRGKRRRRWSQRVRGRDSQQGRRPWVLNSRGERRTSRVFFFFLLWVILISGGRRGLKGDLASGEEENSKSKEMEAPV